MVDGCSVDCGQYEETGVMAVAVLGRGTCLARQVASTADANQPLPRSATDPDRSAAR